MTIESAVSIRNWAIANGVQTVYFLASIEDLPSAWAAESVGFRLVDVRLTYENKAPTIFEDSRIRRAKLSDHADLELIASKSFHHTRFACDSSFGSVGAARLYSEWLRKSLHGWAQETLVAESEGQPVGFVTCHLADSHGSIGLVAVDEREQGKGFGAALVLSATDWLRKAGASSITVVTQGANISAQRLYLAAGFEPKCVELWFHLSLDRGL